MLVLSSNDLLHQVQSVMGSYKKKENYVFRMNTYELYRLFIIHTRFEYLNFSSTFLVNKGLENPFFFFLPNFLAAYLPQISTAFTLFLWKIPLIFSTGERQIFL